MFHDGSKVLEARLPAEFPPRLSAVGHEHGGVAGAAFLGLRRDGLAGDAPGGVDDLLHGKACAIAQIEGIAFAFGQ